MRMCEYNLGCATYVKNVLSVPGPGEGEAVCAPSGEAVDPAGGVNCAGG